MWLQSFVLIPYNLYFSDLVLEEDLGIDEPRDWEAPLEGNLDSEVDM